MLSPGTRALKKENQREMGSVYWEGRDGGGLAGMDGVCIFKRKRERPPPHAPANIVLSISGSTGRKE